MKLKHIIILQNKIDLVTQPQAKEQYQQIIKFVQGTNNVIQGANSLNSLYFPELELEKSWNGDFLVQNKSFVLKFEAQIRSNFL